MKMIKPIFALCLLFFASASPAVAAVPLNQLLITFGSFLGATNDKIRALKAEDLVDERFVKKLEQEGRFEIK